VLDLPLGSTPIDFAYIIHTDIGHKCVMAKCNGSIVPLNRELKNGEVVEVITRSNASPKLEWLTFVKTGGARTKIKTYFRSFNKEDNFKEGKDLINGKLEQLGKSKLDPKLTILKQYEDRNLSLKEREELVRQVGSGSMLPSVLLRKVFSSDELIGKRKVKKIVPRKVDIRKESEIGKYIVVGGEKGLPVRRAQCCKPAFGEPIVGFITRGRAISIHKKDCRIFKMSNESRHMNASWIGMPEDEVLRRVSLFVETTPNTHIMREVSKAVEQSNGSILQFYIKKETQKALTWEILIEINDFDQFEKVLASIESTEGVYSVRKIT
jgi:GTP pyrophosphokinase